MLVCTGQSPAPPAAPPPPAVQPAWPALQMCSFLSFTAHLLTPLTFLQVPCFLLVSESSHVEFLVPSTNKASWVIYLLCRGVNSGLILLKHYFWFLKHILISSNLFYSAFLSGTSYNFSDLSSGTSVQNHC